MHFILFKGCCISFKYLSQTQKISPSTFSLLAGVVSVHIRCIFRLEHQYITTNSIYVIEPTHQGTTDPVLILVTENGFEARVGFNGYL